MRKGLEERNTGMRRRFTEDLDFDDDLALLSSTGRPIAYFMPAKERVQRLTLTKRRL